ncbi:alpha/beta fold hydrolase [Frigoribacterium salinisoli]
MSAGTVTDAPRLPRAAGTTAPATLPPAGLPGLDPRWSRLVEAPTSEPGVDRRTWHLLDTGAVLEAAGVEPVGTVLCVHGNPTWSYLWRHVAARATETALAGGAAWRVVAVDQLDMGFSERTGVARTLPRRVADLGDLTEHLELAGPVVTLGHDWGGVVSSGWAIDHPELLAGLTLLNTAVHQPEGEPIPWPLRLTLARGVLGRATVSTTGFLDVTLALGHPALPPEVRRAYRAPYGTPERRGGIGGFVADIPVDAAHPSTPELERLSSGLRDLDVPALFLWGPRDPIFGDRYLDDLVERLPHADVHRFEGAGHLVAEDRDVSGALLTWLDDHAEALLGAPRTGAGAGAARALAQEARTTAPAAGVDDAPAPPAAARPPLWARLDELRDSDGTALVEMAPSSGGGPRRVSWRLLARRVDELVQGLHASGVRPGDRVSLLVQPGADLTAVLYACVRLGAVVVVADAGLGLAGLTRAVRGAWPDHVVGALPGLSAARALGWPGRKISTTRLPAPLARTLGVEASLADVVALGRHALDAGAEPLPVPSPDDVAAILFTSGSTGPAKGVVYLHRQLSALRDALAEQYGVGVGTGLVAGFAPFALLGPALGATSVTPDMDVTAPRTLTARAVAASAAAVDATVVFLSPAALTNVVATSDALDDADRRALAAVKTFLSAGAPVSERLLAAAGDLMPGAVPHTPYGMTEGLLMTDVTLEGVRAAAAGADAGVCVGVPGPGVLVRIAALDEAGRASGPLSDETGVTGEVVVSAPHVEHRYDRLWLTDRASRRVADEGDAGLADRWHRTGDVGHLDADGRLWIEGRLPHVLTTPRGVLTPVGPEQRVESVAGVARAAVVGIGPAGTQQVVVVAETVPPTRRPGLAPRELADAVRAAAQVPVAAVLVVPGLPTDVRHNSKIDRGGLSAWAGSVLAGGRMTRPDRRGPFGGRVRP